MAEQTVATSPAVPASNEAGAPATREETRYLIPPVDIYETADGLAVLADLPGVDRDGVEVRVDNGILTLRGRVQKQLLGSPVSTEFALLDFFRQFELNDEVDQEKISAELRHGVLKVLLPKAERVKPRRIAVQVG